MGGPGLKHGVLRVWRQFSRINGEMVEAPLKTKNTYRALLLAENTVSVLEVQRKKTGSSPCVFPSPAGGPISPDCVGKMLHRALRRVGLPRVRFHDLRHAFGAEDGIRDTETLLGGVHPGHLRPCDHGLPTGRRPNYGQYPPRQAPDLTAPQSRMGYGLGLGIFSLRIRQRRTYNATCANDAHKARFEF